MRFAFPVLLGLAAISVSCVSRGVRGVPSLPPTLEATLGELVAHVNRWAAVDSLVLRVDLQFETVDEAEEGRGRRFRSAQGRLLLRRPGSIRLDIEAPVLSASIAEMASDGERFQLLIHPSAYRALIEGRNDRSYEEETAKLHEDPELEKAGPLVNIRPQHFTDALLIPPIDLDDPHTVALRQEERVLEPDERPGAERGSLVRKSYYVVTALRLGERAPRRQYWFDRVGDIRLARQRIFDAEGRLVGDVRYGDYLPPQAEGGPWIASSIRIERPYDDYALALTVRPDGVTVNRELPDRAFVVSTPPEWGDIRHIDLEARSSEEPGARARR